MLIWKIRKIRKVHSKNLETSFRKLGNKALYSECWRCDLKKTKKGPYFLVGKFGKFSHIRKFDWENSKNSEFLFVKLGRLGNFTSTSQRVWVDTIKKVLT